MNRPAKVGLAFGLACATGCEPSPETVPLTDGQWEIVHRKIDDLARSEPMYTALVNAAGLPASDLESAREGRELTKQLAADGQIFGYHGEGSSQKHRDAFAYFHKDISGARFIALNLDAEMPFEYLDSHALLHEAIHDQKGAANHPDEIEEYTEVMIAARKAYTTEEFAEMVLEHGDPAYLATLIGAIPDRLIYRAVIDLQAAGDVPNLSIAKDQVGWAEDMVRDVVKAYPYLDVFGVAEDDLRRIFLADATIYREAHEAWVSREAAREDERSEVDSRGRK
jgi:hypothetical protein